jgi:uncharacterized membrane protein YoaK (UPF0700 family)
MLRKYSNSRSLRDNIQLGVLTAFSAGMVNVASVIIFFSFTSNITGHYAILASEIAKGQWYQVSVVFAWIFLFFLGSFFSNFIIINLNRKNAYLAHSLPLMLELVCLLAVGIYGQYYYRETLIETEILVGFMLFAMGLQNGLTASISNFAVKTTHLTGLTTDLGILLSMFTQKEFRENPALVGRAKLLVSIMVSYVGAGILSALLYHRMQFRVFFFVAFVIVVIILYDYSRLRLLQLLRRRWNIGQSLEARIETLQQDEKAVEQVA